LNFFFDILDIEGLEREIEEKDKKNQENLQKINKLTTDLGSATTKADDAVKNADQKNSQLTNLVQKFFDHNTQEVVELDRKK